MERNICNWKSLVYSNTPERERYKRICVQHAVPFHCTSSDCFCVFPVRFSVLTSSQLQYVSKQYYSLHSIQCVQSNIQNPTPLNQLFTSFSALVLPAHIVHLRIYKPIKPQYDKLFDFAGWNFWEKSFAWGKNSTPGCVHAGLSQVGGWPLTPGHTLRSRCDQVQEHESDFINLWARSTGLLNTDHYLLWKVYVAHARCWCNSSKVGLLVWTRVRFSPLTKIARSVSTNLSQTCIYCFEILGVKSIWELYFS